MWGSLLGAAAGAGLGSLMGGNRESILGGGLLGGLGGYGAESGAFGDYTQGIAKDAIGSLGSVKDVAAYTGIDGTKHAASQLYTPNSGLLGLGQDLYNSSSAGLLGDLSTTYGQVQGGLSQRKMAQAEADYRNRLAKLQEDEYNYIAGNRDKTQAGLSAGFASSAMGQPSNYYSA